MKKTRLIRLGSLSTALTVLSASSYLQAAAPLRTNQPYAEATKCVDPNVIFCEDFNYPQNFVCSPTGNQWTNLWNNPGFTENNIADPNSPACLGRQINPVSDYPAQPSGSPQGGSVWVSNWDPAKGVQDNGASWGRLRSPSGNYANGSLPAKDLYFRFQLYWTLDIAWPGDPKLNGYDYGTDGTGLKILYIFPPEGTANPTGATYDAGMQTHTGTWDPTNNARFADALTVRIGDPSDSYKSFPLDGDAQFNPQHMEYAPFQSLTLRDPNDQPLFGRIFRFNTNRWYNVEMRYKLGSSAGARDGIVEIWIDGTKIYSANDLETCGFGLGDCSGIGAMVLTAYRNFGDTTVPDGQMVIDNLIVSRSYIGLPSSTPSPDTTPPTVSITQPTNQATVSGIITVSATASDNVGVAGVQFKLDGGNLGTEDTTSPYSIFWNTTQTTNGSHTLTAIARDAAGNTTTSTQITVMVSNATPDTQAPSLPTNLTATAISSSQINLSWTASTDNVGVAGYKIYRCAGSGCTPSTQIGTSATNSYSHTGLTASTTYTYAVSAYDTAGNESGKSSSVSVTTKAPVDTTPPARPRGFRIK